jgi:hypothetical protein
LVQLNNANDKHLKAAWEAYTVLKNSEDLADTLAVLCDVKRETLSKNIAAPTAGSQTQGEVLMMAKGGGYKVTLNQQQQV